MPITQPNDSTHFYNLCVLGDKLYSYHPGRSSLRESDGTTAGTVATDVAALPSYLSAVAGRLYFFDFYSKTVMVSDGTAGGTSQLRSLDPSFYISTARRFIEFESHVYFSGVDDFGARIWRTDGTPEGTIPVAAFFDVQELVEFNGGLYTSGADIAHGQELWRLSGHSTVV